MPNEDQNKAIRAALKRIASARIDVALFYQYYQGDHAMNFSSTKFKNKFGRRLQYLNDNLCKSVVNAPVNRLEVTGFSSETEAAAGDAFWQIWKRNALPRRSKQVHREAFRAGRSYIVVWADGNGRARVDVQNTSDMVVQTDGEGGKITEAAKLWFDEITKKHYLTLYYPDRIEKYETKKVSASYPNGNGFTERTIEGEAWPLANPFNRVPVFEFAAPEKLSILQDVIPLQDALNKHFADMMVAGEYNSIRQRYTAGIQYDVDPETDKPIIPFDHDDPVWSTDNPEGKFGEFSESQLEQYLKAKTDAREEIARVTGIPSHYFQLATGDFPSGEALRTSESRFISMVQDAQLEFGETWADAMAFASQIENSQVSTDLEPQQIETMWRDAAPVGMKELLENATMKMALGVPLETLLGELGYADADVKKMLDLAAKEKARAQAELERAFNAGAPVDQAPDSMLM